MDHPWFSDIDWSTIMSRVEKAPYLPYVSEDNWIENFDSNFTENDCTHITLLTLDINAKDSR